jgi:hypothetical protein
MLLIWTYIMIVAGSFSLARPLMNAIPVNEPKYAFQHSSSLAQAFVTDDCATVI